MRTDAWSIHRRRMERYKALPSVRACAACGKGIRVGTRRTYLHVDVPRAATLALHPKCADSELHLTPAVLRVGGNLRVLLAAGELLAALDERARRRGAERGAEHLRSTVQYIERVAARRVRARRR